MKVGKSAICAQKNEKFLPSVMTYSVFIHPSTLLFLPKQKERTKEKEYRGFYIQNSY